MNDQLLADRDRSTTWWRTPRGRIGLAVVVLTIVLGGIQLSSQRSADWTVLAVPSPLSQNTSEVRRRLHQAGVMQFEYSNGQLQLPVEMAEIAGSALLTESPADRLWADEWEEANSKLGHFSGSRERDAAREIARARQISRMLSQMSGIAHADVVWDDDKSEGWNRTTRSRATVYLKPKPGSEITPEIIRSVRSAVAGSKANLSAEDVIVMDLDRRITYEATSDEPFQRQQDQQRDERSAIYRRRIEQLLQHVDHIRVGVFIEDIPYQSTIEHPWADPLDRLTSRLPAVAPPMPANPQFTAIDMVRHPPSKTGAKSLDSKSAASLLGLNQELAELVHVHLAVPEEFYLRKLDMLADAEELAFEMVERDVNEQLQKRVREALPDSGPTPEIMIDLIPGERLASLPVVSSSTSAGPFQDPSVLYPLCGIGLVFFALGWAIVAARRDHEEIESTHDLSPPVQSSAELHSNPLEFLATTRFTDWLPALLMEPTEALAQVVSVLPSQHVGDLLARLPASAQIDVLQTAARQHPPTIQELEKIAQRLQTEVDIPTFHTHGRLPRANMTSHEPRGV